MYLNLAAFTPPTNPYPPYASANLLNERVELSVRSPAAADGTCGTTSCVSFSLDEFQAFVDAASERLRASREFLEKLEPIFKGVSLRKRVYDALDRAKANGFDYSSEQYATENDLSVASDLLDCSNEFDDLEPHQLARFVRAWRVRGDGTLVPA